MLSGSLDDLICVLMVVELLPRLLSICSVAQHHVNRPVTKDVVVHQRRCDEQTSIVFVLIVEIICLVSRLSREVVKRIARHVDVVMRVLWVAVSGVDVEVDVKRH